MKQEKLHLTFRLPFFEHVVRKPFNVDLGHLAIIVGIEVSLYSSKSLRLKRQLKEANKVQNWVLTFRLIIYFWTFSVLDLLIFTVDALTIATLSMIPTRK